MSLINPVGSASLLLGGAAGAYSAITSIFSQNANRGVSGVLSSGQSLLFRAEAIIEEMAEDEVQITDHPVQVGATISDHAFKLPPVVRVTYGWSNSLQGLVLGGASSSATLAETTFLGGYNEDGAISSYFGTSKANTIYGNLLSLQQQQILCNVQTGRRLYTNMLLKSLRQTTDPSTENSLIVIAEFRNIQIVTAFQTADLPSTTQETPQDTASDVNSGVNSLSTVNVPGS